MCNYFWKEGVNKAGKTWEKAKFKNMCGETVSLAACSSSLVVCHVN